MCRSPPAIAVANTQVPATMRSVTVRCSTGCSPSTPSITRVEVEIPSMSAPIETSIWHRSMISGSRATLSITVLPLASTAAISRFSVAPTEGKSSHRLAPTRRLPGTSATTCPCSMRTTAPSSCSPRMCMSSPRDPIASPPGRATLASPTPGDERAEHGDRGPQAAYQLIGGLVVQLLRYVDACLARRGPRSRVGGRIDDLDLAAELAQQLPHDSYVEDVGHVVDHRATRCQQGGGHQLQGGVLGTPDVHRAGQRPGHRTLGDDAEAAHARHSSETPTTRRRASDAVQRIRRAPRREPSHPPEGGWRP